ncbi:choice-of-anchor B family protein [Glaciecola sp. MH2013]|uniref:choice-of-anchor B family protein n=1 Tax=Glaciecola sp. MH2013 TaxID=2785524 RepID=UPI00189DBC09|nr:choice-of-anchor B family protein [Glaciecola sp. MH2013]MBF7072185.1 choice-of-anchor B family protein [Glaciecola sp. MH2013]
MKKYLFSLRILLVITIGICAQANAHMDHDKARFVSPDGRDSGDCKNRFRPCASIGYAAEQANKGDVVLVAQGHYELRSFSDVFYLISDIVPAYGGFQTLDNYQAQNPNAFPTTLSGVPLEYAQQLSEKGFNVIVDSKANQSDEALHESAEALDKGLAQVNAMYESQAETACVDGLAGEFPCSNMSLLSHVPVRELTPESTAANDIWGHVDLNTMKEYAIVGSRRAVSLVDVSDPVNPVVINNIFGQNTTWRDIKVLQYFNADMNKWEAYAYATADSASEGLTILNLSNPDDGMILVDRDLSDLSAHNIYISNVDYGLNIQNSLALPQAHILGSSNGGGSLRSYLLTDPENIRSTYRLPGATRADYTHDASSMLINDERAERDCVNASAAGCTVMLDFNEGTLRLWDHSNLNTSVELSSVSYPNAEYTHSGWWSEDRQYVLVHDELDEQRNSLNTTVHVFDVSDLNSPSLVSTWVGPTRAVDHNGFVRGNKYYMSNYERGVTVLDLSDPTAPREIGYFDTFPARTSAGFNGAWGVYPYLPSGIILVSDIQGGLYIIKDETQSNQKDDISFSASQYSVAEGTSLEIAVERSGVQQISVDYHIIRGSTDADDFDSLESGTLSWAADESEPKTITIAPLDDAQGETMESLFIRLENASPSAELITPNIAKVDVLSTTARASLVAINADTLNAKETDASVSLTLTRSGAADTAASVTIELDNSDGVVNSAELGSDLNLASNTLSWGIGEVGDRSLSINIINDDESESTESISFVVSNPDNVTIEGNNRVTLTIRDDESNQAPVVNTDTELNVVERQSVTMTATANDPENDDLSFTWAQTSGTQVTLSSTTGLSTQFTAPNGEGTLSFDFTATDDFGVQSTVSVTVNVEADAQVNPVPLPIPPPPSSSGGAISLINILLLIALHRRYWLAKGNAQRRQGN